MFCARSQRPLRPDLSARLFVPPAGPAKNSGSPLRSASISGMLDSMETPSAETRSLRIPCIFCVSVKGWKAEPSGVSQKRLFILRSRLLFGGHQTRRPCPPRLSADLFSLSRQSSFLPSELSEKAAKPVPQPVARFVHAAGDERLSDHRSRASRRRGCADGRNG